MVEGSGSKVSARPADSMLVMSKCGAATLIDLSTPDKQDTYLMENFHRLVFSLRSKGMSAKAIADPRSKAWTRVDPTREAGKQVRGALHVRLT